MVRLTTANVKMTRWQYLAAVCKFDTDNHSSEPATSKQAPSLSAPRIEPFTIPNDAAPRTNAAENQLHPSIERKNAILATTTFGSLRGTGPLTHQTSLDRLTDRNVAPFVPHDSTHCFLPLRHSTRLHEYGNSCQQTMSGVTVHSRCRIHDSIRPAVLMAGRPTLILVDGNTEPTTESSPHQPPGPGTNPP
jgi:hypothetical protein